MYLCIFSVTVFSMCIWYSNTYLLRKQFIIIAIIKDSHIHPKNITFPTSRVNTQETVELSIDLCKRTTDSSRDSDHSVPGCVLDDNANPR